MASFCSVRERTVIVFILFICRVHKYMGQTIFFKSKICFSKWDKFTLLWFTMWFADCLSFKGCLVTCLRFLRAFGCENALSFFLWHSSLRLWKRVRASTRLCSASSLISLISFSNIITGVIFGFAVYCKDFVQVRFVRCSSNRFMGGFQSLLFYSPQSVCGPCIFFSGLASACWIFLVGC